MNIHRESNGASMNHGYRWSAIGLCFGVLSISLSSAGCAVRADEGDDDVDEIAADTATSFEEFKASVYREPSTGVYIVDGDTPVETDAALELFYQKYIQHGALIVNQVGGVDDRWNNTQKLNITYCVSPSFGANYAAVVQAMAAASAEWRSAAAVKIIYLPAQDPACTALNNSVVFDVSPESGRPYLARAFFPSFSRPNRNILIDSSSFGSIAPYTLAGILRHELGHVLGFRHEHTRPEAGACFEDNNWRSLTAYDSSSVMHYPQCNGTNAGDLVLTATDRAGAASLYGPPCPKL